MKKIISVLLVALCMFSLVGCKDLNKHLTLYNGVNIKEYVEVENYKGIEVDTTSSQFQEYFDAVYNDDVTNNGLYSIVKEGTVANGDIVNLDYEGKLDGVAFEGGTATGYDLTIGSNTFIDDFEEELIGAKIGETRDVTAKFPENYQETSLAGKETVFTCKINYITKNQTVEESYIKLGFKTSAEYKEDIKVRAIKNYLLKTVCDNAKIKSYPTKESKVITDELVNQVKTRFESVGIPFETALAYNGYTVETLRQEIMADTMKVSLATYYIVVAEELEVSQNTINSQGDGIPLVLAEMQAIEDTAINFVYNNANIK